MLAYADPGTGSLMIQSLIGLGIVAFASIWGFITSLIAKAKGSQLFGFIMGFILGPIGLIITLLYIGNRRQCPHCRQWGQSGAAFCASCNRELRS